MITTALVNIVIRCLRTINSTPELQLQQKSAAVTHRLYMLAVATHRDDSHRADNDRVLYNIMTLCIQPNLDTANRRRIRV
jgi:hypothetical protein